LPQSRRRGADELRGGKLHYGRYWHSADVLVTNANVCSQA
jgi:hypothetical protein